MNAETIPAPPPPSTRGMRAILVTVLVSTLLAVVKIVAGILGHAYVLIADGMESTLDIVSAVAVWSGLKVASAPPDEEHPFGHGKAEPLAALVVALLILGAALGIAVLSVREIMTSRHMPALFTLPVLVLVILVKEALFRFSSKTGKTIDSTAVRTDAWHHRSDALTSLAALAGISVALIAGEGYESADDWAALLACGIIAFNGLRLLRNAVDEVMDAAPPPEIERRVRAAAGSVAAVRALHKCRIIKTGFAYYVDLQIRVDGGLSVRRGHEIAHDVKRALADSGLNILDAAVHVEPTEEEK